MAKFSTYGKMVGLSMGNSLPQKRRAHFHASCFSLSFRRVLLFDSESLDHGIDEFVSTNHHPLSFPGVRFPDVAFFRFNHIHLTPPFSSTKTEVNGLGNILGQVFIWDILGL